jgi:hypothetical protein
MAHTSEHTADDEENERRTDGGPTAVEVLRTAGSEFGELTGLRPEAVTRLERSDDGWVIETEVTELRRVPETMSLMAAYEVTTDRRGRLTGYRRLRRYERGRADPR